MDKCIYPSLKDTSNFCNFCNFIKKHKLTFSKNIDASKNQKGGTENSSLKKICIKDEDTNEYEKFAVDILPIDLWNQISNNDILNSKDLLMFSLTNKAFLANSPEKFEIAKYGLAECLLNLAQTLLTLNSEYNFHYQYGIKLRPTYGYNEESRNVFYILVSKSDQEVEITLDTATISIENPRISNNELSSVIVNENNNDPQKIMCLINTFINKTGINNCNIEYIRITPYSQPSQNIIPSPHGALWYKSIDNKVKLVIRQMRSICTDEKEIHDLFEKMFLARQQGGNISTSKIFYKGYYYKLRKEGKRTFILTKHEGEVSLSIIKKWTNQFKIGKND